MAEELKVTIVGDGSIAKAVASMDKYQQIEVGRKTYLFIRRILHDPVLRELHAKKKAELQAEGYFDRLTSPVTMNWDD